MKPATRFLLGGLLLVLALTAVSMTAVIWQTNRTEQAHTLQRLRDASVVERDLQSLRLGELQLRAQVLVSDQAFVAYVAQSMIPNPDQGGLIDRASISDLLNERRHGYDSAMVLDPSGKFIASSGLPVKDQNDIQSDPLVTRAIAQGSAVQGLWQDHGQLSMVAVNPLMRAGAMQGLLVVATRLDDAFAIAIGRITHLDVAIIAPGPGSAVAAATSGLQLWSTQALNSGVERVLAIQDRDGQALPLSASGYNTTAWASPLHTSGGSSALVALDPDAGSAAGIDADSTPMLIGIGVLGLLGILSVLWLWARTWVPLQDMRDVISRAAHGDQFMTVRNDGSPIVRYVRDTINTLLKQQRG